MQTQTCTVSSNASAARSINVENKGNRSGRSPTPDGLGQSKPLKSHPERSWPSQTLVLIPLCLPNRTSTRQVTTLPRYVIAVPPSTQAAWGSGAAPVHPSDPKTDGFLAGAGKTSPPLAAALQGRRAPLLASLVVNGFFLTSCVIRI